MNPLKKLAGQTAVYGMGTIVPRLLNYLLVPYYTGIFKTAEYAVISELYAYVAFFLALLTFGMETAFFRFASLRKDRINVYSTVLMSVLSASLLFVVLILLSFKSISSWIDYAGNPEFILYVGLIVAMDAVASIPSAMLRQLNRARKFSIIKLSSVAINVGLNLFLITLCPWVFSKYPDHSLTALFNKENLLSFVFLANVISSLSQIFFLRKEIGMLRLKFDKSLFKEMIKYAIPIAIIGLAGMLNEVADRGLFKHLYLGDDAMSQLGIYGANFKLAVMMTLFIQMFRYAAEPFFFAQAKENNAKEVYAQVMKYFVFFGLVIFLLITLYMDVFKFFITNESYWVGLDIVPIVLLANLFLGVFYNLSVWYKLNNLTKYGAYIALIGTSVTLFVNFAFVPKYGYHAAAWGHLACYLVMIIISYFWGRKVYPVNYELKKIVAFTIVALGLYYLSQAFRPEDIILRLTYNSFLFLAFFIFVFFNERNNLKAILKGEI
ncbi:MAG: polysaccharide biosynthesis C-terminal domain-containing protein [Bacteroidales bacterium]|nr:polysaccharide biosynthesis C-terminal domain-containing protein [Bacteroidales bacterium]